MAVFCLAPGRARVCGSVAFVDTDCGDCCRILSNQRPCGNPALALLGVDKLRFSALLYYLAAQPRRFIAS